MFEPGGAERWLAAAADLRLALERDGWDGEWYRRGYFDDGTPLGSALNDECRIDSIAQSWSVISGHGDHERSRIALDSVERLLFAHLSPDTIVMPGHGLDTTIGDESPKLQEWIDRGW